MSHHKCQITNVILWSVIRLRAGLLLTKRFLQPMMIAGPLFLMSVLKAIMVVMMGIPIFQVLRKCGRGRYCWSLGGSWDLASDLWAIARILHQLFGGNPFPAKRFWLTSENLIPDSGPQKKHFWLFLVWTTTFLTIPALFYVPRVIFKNKKFYFPLRKLSQHPFCVQNVNNRKRGESTSAHFVWRYQTSGFSLIGFYLVTVLEEAKVALPPLEVIFIIIIQFH